MHGIARGRKHEHPGTAAHRNPTQFPIPAPKPQSWHAEPRLMERASKALVRSSSSALPRKTSRRVRPTRTYDLCELANLGECAADSKEQIDALQRLISNGMPPKTVLDNVFAALRHAVATDIEGVMDQQWQYGVKHGEWLSAPKIAELQPLAAEIDVYKDQLLRLQVDRAATSHDWHCAVRGYTQLPSGVDWPHYRQNDLCTPLLESECADDCDNLMQFLQSLPKSAEAAEAAEPTSGSDVSDEIDMYALKNEIDHLSGVLA